MGCGASLMATAVALPGGPPEELDLIAASNDLKSDYNMLEEIGSGSYGSCFRAERRVDGMEVAVKSLMRDSSKFKADRVLHEIKMLQSHHHPSCIHLLAYYEDKDAVHIVTNLASGGDLLSRLMDKGKQSEPYSQKIVYQVFEALAYLHDRNIVHRDVKPENILMVSGDPNSADYNTILLSDFGMSQKRDNIMTDVLKTLIGTPEFSAPEILRIARQGKQSTTNPRCYSCAIDNWAAGCVLYTMLTACTPFCSDGGKCVPQMIERIINGKYSNSQLVWAQVSTNCMRLIHDLLEVDPNQRLTAAKALEHAAFKPINNLSRHNSMGVTASSSSCRKCVLAKGYAMGSESFAAFARHAKGQINFDIQDSFRNNENDLDDSQLYNSFRSRGGDSQRSPGRTANSFRSQEDGENGIGTTFGQRSPVGALCRRAVSTPRSQNKGVHMLEAKEGLFEMTDTRKRQGLRAKPSSVMLTSKPLSDADIAELHRARMRRQDETSFSDKSKSDTVEADRS